MSRVPSFLSNKGWVVIGALVAFWALSVAARLLWHGEIYGLNYGVLHGDGACYSFAAYTYAGIPERGITDINAAYQSAGVPIVDLTVPGICSDLKLGARIFYPMISAPFVKAFGISGMLVAPAVAWLLAVLVPAVMLLRRGLFFGPLVAGGLALASTSIARWSVANITDAVLMGLAALMLLLLPIDSFRKGWWRVAGIAFLVALASLTRQSWPIWIGMVVVPWLMIAGSRGGGGWKSAARWSNPWFALVMTVVPVALVSHLIVTAVLGSQNSAHLASVVERQVVTSIGEPSESSDQPSESSDQPSESSDRNGETARQASSEMQNAKLMSQWTALIQYALKAAVNVAITDVGQLVVLDRSLVILLALALFGAFVNRRWSATYAFLGVFGATVVLSLLNTTLGVNFRFQLPAVPFIVLMAGVTLIRNPRELPWSSSKETSS